jgi:ATP-dependent Clp protease protease subunit
MKSNKGSAPKRLVRIVGSIDPENYLQFTEAMKELEDASDAPITIELCSHGGDTYVGLAFYGRITCSPCKITIKAFGQVMSAATIIFVAGDVRIMHKDAWFMIHDDSQRIKADNGQIAISEAMHSEQLEYHWADILARHTKLSLEEWRALSKRTTYLSASRCLEGGVTDEILG